MEEKFGVFLDAVVSTSGYILYLLYVFGRFVLYNLLVYTIKMLPYVSSESTKEELCQYC